MNKQTRKEKKAEKARVLAEMKAALEEAERTEKGENGENGENAAEESASTSTQKPQPAFQASTYHCRRCKAAMKNGVCPTCGFKMYVPMDEKKLGKIKLVLTAVGMAIFIAIFLYIQIKNG